MNVRTICSELRRLQGTLQIVHMQHRAHREQWGRQCWAWVAVAIDWPQEQTKHLQAQLLLHPAANDDGRLVA